MKIRVGFVSNSSSSSFMLGLGYFDMDDKKFVDDFTKKSIKDLGSEYKDNHHVKIVTDSIENLRKDYTMKNLSDFMSGGLKFSEEIVAVVSQTNDNIHIWDNLYSCLDKEDKVGMLAFWFNDIALEIDENKIFRIDGRMKEEKLTWFKKSFRKFYRNWENQVFKRHAIFNHIYHRFGVARNG